MITMKAHPREMDRQADGRTDRQTNINAIVRSYVIMNALRDKNKTMHTP